MDTHNIILDCDWFVASYERLIKQIAFVDCFTGAEYLYVFNFPSELKRFKCSFESQARHSHGIPWNKRGSYHLGEVCCVLQTIHYVVNAGSSKVVFWAKGGEKCDIFSRHGITVNNLETIGAPKFSVLSNQRPTTLLKAQTFAKWFRGVNTFFNQPMTRETFRPITEDQSTGDDSSLGLRVSPEV